MATLLIFYFITLITIKYYVEGLFLHEPSYMEIRPSLVEKDFGFSIAYQVNNSTKCGTLLIGAPHSKDSMGHVYKCQIDQILKGENICEIVPIDVKTTPNIVEDRLNPKQSYCLGASIASTSNYFVTCAPLVSKKVRLSRTDKKGIIGVTGTCFIYNGTHSIPLQGLPEQQEHLLEERRAFPTIGPLIGGLGWTSITDEANKQILIPKSTLTTNDVVFVDMTKPYEFANSLVLDSNPKDSTSQSNRNSLNESINLGYGVAAGKFFSNDTLYAVSLQNMQMKGMIAFLTSDRKILKQPLNKEQDLLLFGSSEFGAALEAADVNDDGLSDLIVGAPAHCADDAGYDVGAVYIYLGGDMININAAERQRVILASKFGSHFGSAIAATDIDGDSLPEIFVSAPYEDFGKGAVYVLSGYEIQTVLLSESSVRDVSLTDLRFTQRLQIEEARTFGYSLKVLSDIDDIGCKDLAVGAIGSSNVIILRCIPAVTVNLFSKLVNEVVKDSDNGVTVETCINVTYHSRSENIVGDFQVTSKLEGHKAFLVDSSFNVDLSLKPHQYCHNITVEFLNVEPGTYNISSALNASRLNHDEVTFNKGWVTLSPHSKTETFLTIKRQCAEPSLEMHLFWINSEMNHTDYVLGTSEMETVTVVVKSEQDSECEMCVRIRKEGLHVASIPCGIDGEDYRCFLPLPMAKNSEHSIPIVLDMSKFTNMDKKFVVDARLFYDCKSETFNIKKELTLALNLNSTGIDIISSSQNTSITDTEIFKIKDDAEPLLQIHKYVIVNENSVKWVNASILLWVENKASEVYDFQVPYFENRKNLLDFNSKSINSSKIFSASVDITPSSNLTILLTIRIYPKQIANHYTKNGIEIYSGISIDLQSSFDRIEKSLKTFIFYEREMSLKHNKNIIIIIAIILAVIIFLMVAFILYKRGFFERKSKKQLELCRKMSMKPETENTSEIPEQVEMSSEQLLPMSIDNDDRISLPEEQGTSAHLDSSNINNLTL